MSGWEGWPETIESIDKCLLETFRLKITFITSKYKAVINALILFVLSQHHGLVNTNLSLPYPPVTITNPTSTFPWTWPGSHWSLLLTCPSTGKDCFCSAPHYLPAFFNSSIVSWDSGNPVSNLNFTSMCSPILSSMIFPDLFNFTNILSAFQMYKWSLLGLRPLQN